MPRIFNLSLLVIGVIVSLVGFAAFSRIPAMTAILIAGAGVAIVILAMLSDRHRVRSKEQRHAEVQAQIAELTKSPWVPGQRLAVRSGPGMFLGSLFLGVFGVLALFTELPEAAGADAHFVIFGTLLLVMAVIGVPRSAAEFFNPALELSVQGIDSPLHGRISWSEITGIDLQRTEIKGFVSYLLHFRVENYWKIVKEMHWTEHVLGLFRLGANRRGYITVYLGGRNGQAEVAFAVARFLWKQETGSDYLWSPFFSRKENDQIKRNWHTDRKLEKLERLAESVVSNPEQVLQELNQIEESVALTRSERKRESYRQKWVVLIALVVLFALLVTIAFKFL